MHGAGLTAVLPFTVLAFAVLPFTVLPCTVLVCNSCLGSVCFPLHARDSIDWFAGAKMDQC